MSRPFPKWPSGAWKVICDVCGVVYPSTDVRKRWDGLMVCPSDYEDRHPQDFIRAIPDNPSVPWTRPEGPDQFVPYCTQAGQSGYATIGVAGCMIAGNDTYSNVFLYETFIGETLNVPPFPDPSPPPPLVTSNILTEDGFNLITEDGYYLVQ